MTLLEDYQAEGGEFNAKIVAALAKAGTDILLLLTGAEPDYKAKVRFIKACLNSESKHVDFVARAMISQGLSNASTDNAIQTAITNNYDKLAALYDPTVEA